MKRVIAALALGLIVGSATTAFADSNDSVQAVFAKFNFIVNGEKKEIKTTPLVVEGTSYLPVREVSGLLGYELGYDDATRTINLKTISETGNTINNPGTLKMRGRDLIEIISKKYSTQEVLIGQDKDDKEIAILKIKESTYKLKFIDTFFVDVAPLIDKGVLTNEDLEN